ncbi:hypothetical protein C8J57DRAFT_1510976 [Mycena rebaudengoi]|nr:hypothetical protein C8J57DRAFT_1510976 [Mycena rebaudengoi]
MDEILQSLTSLNDFALDSASPLIVSSHISSAAALVSAPILFVDFCQLLLGLSPQLGLAFSSASDNSECTPRLRRAHQAAFAGASAHHFWLQQRSVLGLANGRLYVVRIDGSSFVNAPTTSSVTRRRREAGCKPCERGNAVRYARAELYLSAIHLGAARSRSHSANAYAHISSNTPVRRHRCSPPAVKASILSFSSAKLLLSVITIFPAFLRVGHSICFASMPWH